MLKKSFHKLLSLVNLEAPYYFWRSGYLENIGWLNSFKLKQPVDASRQAIPWYTYTAIEYIKQLDFSNKEVFEYGCGNSTIFWAKIAKSVISVENSQEWHDIVSKKLGKNAALKLPLDEDSYINEIFNYDDFDVIIIDGSYRFKCAQIAINKLKPGGLIILDNSDWHVEAAKLLRESNLIQVDMTGLGPINSYTWTTSFFFHRDFNFQPKGVNQPEHGINALKKYVDKN